MLLKDIKKAERLNIDVIEINNMLCLNVAGIGLDSYVAHSFDKLKARGFWSYVKVTLINFLRLQPVHININIPGQELISEDLFVLTMANTRQFGNNAFIAPEAKPNDGIIDIVMVRPFPKILAPFFVYRLFRGTLNKSKYVRYIKTEKPFTIQTDEIRFHIDGEPVKISGEIHVRIKRDALTVLKTKHNKLQNATI
jgi:diacylglycerol kinase family enzyme